VSVTVPAADIAATRERIVQEYCSKLNIPGFRIGRVPRKLVEARCQQQLADELRQRVLVSSLEQLTIENDIDPINEPDMDVENLEIPAVGDFTYAFEVEVRPDVQVPDYAKLLIKRPTRTIEDADIEKYITRLLLEFGVKTPTDEAAAAGDYVLVDVEFEHNGNVIREMSTLSLRAQPKLRFTDGELTGFDVLISGAKAGETRTGEITISKEAAAVAMRNEVLKTTFKISEVSKFQSATLTNEVLDRIGVEDEAALRTSVRQILERHVVYRQRQSCRAQLLEQITESATWELPEDLVVKQVENALYREVFEMQQAGYTPKEIQARENELRQNAVSVTRQAMKEHFVLDKIATEEKIEVSPSEIEYELTMMAFQSGESPRRIRAKLEKSGAIENLEAQIRERKAVDFILEKASFEDVPDQWTPPENSHPVELALCELTAVVEPGLEEEAAG